MGERTYGNKTWQMILDETQSSISLLCDTKGAEYAASDTDQLANFRRRADRFGLPMEAAWALYAGKHWDALETFIRDVIEKRDRPRSEPLEGRVDDLIVYLILFKAMLAERASALTSIQQAQNALAIKGLDCRVCRKIIMQGCARQGCPFEGKQFDA